MKIRWNWGTGIFLTVVAMLSFVGFMVNKTFDYKINKVSDDYYEKGLSFSDQMKRIENSLPYKDEFDVIHTDVCTVHFPEHFAGKKMSGEILFFRPSDFEKDQKFEIDIDTNGNQVFSLDHFYKGRYIVRVTIEDSLEYFFEKDIIF